MASCWWQLARTPPWTMLLPSCPRLVLGLWGVWESLRSGTMPADVGEDTLCDEGGTFHVSAESFGVSHGLLSSFCAATTYLSGLRDLCASSNMTACHLTPCLFGCNQSRVHSAHASSGVCSPAGGQRHHTHSEVRLAFFCPLWDIWTLSLIYIQMLIDQCSCNSNLTHVDSWVLLQVLQQSSALSERPRLPYASFASIGPSCPHPRRKLLRSDFISKQKEQCPGKARLRGQQ